MTFTITLHGVLVAVEWGVGLSAFGLICALIGAALVVPRWPG